MIKSFKRTIIIGIVTLALILLFIFGLRNITFRASTNNTATPIGNVTPISAIKQNFKIGDYITFGKYYDEAILWRVINIESDGSPLLFMQNVITLKAFDAGGDYHKDSERNKYGSNYWADSSIRQWLNSDAKNIEWGKNRPSGGNVFEGRNPYDTEPGFLYEANFNKMERDAIKSVEHKVLLSNIDEGRKAGGTEAYKISDTISNFKSNYDRANYENVTDKVRLLSVEELHDFVYDRGFELWRKPTAKAIEKSTVDHGSLTTSDYWEYWLSTPDTRNSYAPLVVYLDINSFYGAYFGSNGVVAALNLKPEISKNAGSGTIKEPYTVLN